jgi:hypothetical protein
MQLLILVFAVLMQTKLSRPLTLPAQSNSRRLS